MPVNASLPLQYRAPELMTPDKLLTLKTLSQQNQLGQMQIEDAQRAREEEGQLRQILSDPTAIDPKTGTLSLDAINRAYGVSPTKGSALATNRTKSLKEVAEMHKLEIENKTALAKYGRDGLASVRDQFTYDLWRQDGARMGLQAAVNAPAVFDPKWQRDNLMTADKFIAENTPKIELVDVGGEKKPIDTNPVTNPAIKGTVLAKTQTPAEKAASARAEATAKVEEGKARNTQENQMRDDFTRASVEFVKVRDAHQRVIESAADPSAAGDLSLIFNYMKVLDPGSTVREGEFATAQNAGGVDQRAVALYNRVVRGERLSPEQRADFVDRSERLYKGAVTNQEKTEADYEGKARGAGVRPEQVITKHRVTPKEKKAQEPLSPAEQEELRALRARFKQ